MGVELLQQLVQNREIAVKHDSKYCVKNDPQPIICAKRPQHAQIMHSAKMITTTRNMVAQNSSALEDVTPTSGASSASRRLSMSATRVILASAGKTAVI